MYILSARYIKSLGFFHRKQISCFVIFKTDASALSIIDSLSHTGFWTKWSFYSEETRPCDISDVMKYVKVY